MRSVRSRRGCRSPRTGALRRRGAAGSTPRGRRPGWDADPRPTAAATRPRRRPRAPAAQATTGARARLDTARTVSTRPTTVRRSPTDPPPWMSSRNGPALDGRSGRSAVLWGGVGSRHAGGRGPRHQSVVTPDPGCASRPRRTGRSVPSRYRDADGAVDRRRGRRYVRSSADRVRTGLSGHGSVDAPEYVVRRLREDRSGKPRSWSRRVLKTFIWRDPARRPVRSGRNETTQRRTRAATRWRAARVRQRPSPPGERRATAQRWQALADLAAADLSVARLVEGHFDAVAILHELGSAPPRPRSAGGVGRPARGARRPPRRGMGARRSQALLLGIDGPRCRTRHRVDRRRRAAVPRPRLGGRRGPDVVATARDGGDPQRDARLLRRAGRRRRRASASRARTSTGRGSATAGCGVAACWWGGATACWATSAPSCGREREVHARRLRPRRPGRGRHRPGAARRRRRDRRRAVRHRGRRPVGGACRYVRASGLPRRPRRLAAAQLGTSPSSASRREHQRPHRRPHDLPDPVPRPERRRPGRTPPRRAPERLC